MFSKDDFKKANEGNDNPAILNGDFKLKICRIQIKRMRPNGSQFGIAFTPVEGEHAGKWCWINNGIYDKDTGAPNHIGLRMMQTTLKQLSNSMWSLDDWQEEADEDAQIANVNNNLERFTDTVFQASVETKQNGEYTNYKFKFSRLIESKYSAGVASTTTTSNPTDDDGIMDDTEEDLKEGQAIVFANEQGEKTVGVVVTFIDAQGEGQEGQIMVKTDAGQVLVGESKVLGIVSAEDVAANDIPADVSVSPGLPTDNDLLDDDDELDIVEDIDDEGNEIKIEKGQTVKVKNSKGDVEEGTVHKVDEMTGDVLVAVKRAGKDKPVGVKSTISDLKALNYG